MRSVVILVSYALAANAQAAFRRFEWYRDLYRQFDFYVPESIKTTAGLAICLIVALAIYGRGDHFGLNGRRRRELVWGAAASTPLLLGLLATRGAAVSRPISLLFLAILFPLCEEMVSRGFAFGRLYLRERWSWWMAAVMVAAITGLAHVDKSQSPLDVLGLFALTGFGGVVFSWLFSRWESIWFPFALHASMNLWWELFSVNRSALGGWFAFVLQMTCVICAVVVTLWLTPRMVPDGRVHTNVRGNDRESPMRCTQARAAA
jgi:membrane protease YdiL (CAAX protease family)